MKYYKRSWKITKCMVNGVPHGLENGLEKSITGESKWMVDEVHALGLWNFDKYTVRPRIIEGVETGILAIGSSFGHYR